MAPSSWEICASIVLMGSGGMGVGVVGNGVAVGEGGNGVAEGVGGIAVGDGVGEGEVVGDGTGSWTAFSVGVGVTPLI